MCVHHRHVCTSVNIVVQIVREYRLGVPTLYLECDVMHVSRDWGRPLQEVRGVGIESSVCTLRRLFSDYKPTDYVIPCLLKMMAYDTMQP
jgi:hypothetical protein